MNKLKQEIRRIYELYLAKEKIRNEANNLARLQFTWWEKILLRKKIREIDEAVRGIYTSLQYFDRYLGQGRNDQGAEN